ncbi:MAG: alpha/beta hydrolase family esterase [Panacagrimonas sp.]
MDASARLPRYLVRAPSNYDARFAHPLLVVFSPAGLSAGLTERFTGLTAMATAHGLIVAYVDHFPLGLERARWLANLPAKIAADWCIDPARVTLAGHSDGGTVAQVIALVDAQKMPAPVAIVASAAGLLESDFPTLTCPARMHVLLLHGRSDDHFPGYGESAAQGWARCLRCDADPQADAEGCLAYRNCSGGLRLCLHEGSHLTWPDEARGRIVRLAAEPAD